MEIRGFSHTNPQGLTCFQPYCRVHELFMRHKSLFIYIKKYMHVRLFGQQWWVVVSKESRKALSTITIAGLLVMYVPVGLGGWSFAFAAVDPLFSDNFDQTGSSLTNGWVTVNDSPSRTGTNAVSGKALNHKGGSGTDDSSERSIATKGYDTLHLAYKVRTTSLDTGETFKAEYYLDGTLVDSDIWTSSATNQTISEDKTKDLTNTDRHTKLTIRFTVTSDISSDVVGVDDMAVTGEGSPLYWTGFEATSLSADGWTTEDSPDLITDQSEIWTDATDNGSADGKAAHMNGGTDPDDAFMRTVSEHGRTPKH